MKIKEVQIEHPYYGYRRIWRELNKRGGDTTETTVRRVMRRFEITTVFPGKNLSKTCKYHKKYPYLLKNKVIRYPNQVWSTDITYIKLSCNLQHRPGKPVYIYLKRYETMKDLKAGVDAWFNFYNTARFHQSLDYNVPDEMYKCFQYNKLRHIFYRQCFLQSIYPMKKQVLLPC